MHLFYFLSAKLKKILSSDFYFAFILVSEGPFSIKEQKNTSRNQMKRFLWDFLPR